jgi:hypothetical protein
MPTIHAGMTDFLDGIHPKHGVIPAGNAGIQEPWMATVQCKAPPCGNGDTSTQLAHPGSLDAGNPCRRDGIF